MVDQSSPTLEQDASVVWSACQNIRHGKNYGSQLTDAGALSCYAQHHPNPTLRRMAEDAQGEVMIGLKPGPEAA